MTQQEVAEKFIGFLSPEQKEEAAARAKPNDGYTSILFDKVSARIAIKKINI